MTMSCCGSRRIAASRPMNVTRRKVALAERTSPSVEFEYVGRTTLRTVGPYTQQDYWFGHPGARVRVDGRDAPSFDGIPNLVRVPSRD